MKQGIFLMIVFFCVSNLMAQDVISVESKKRKVYTEFNIDRLYDKKTGKKISEKDLKKILKNDANVSFEKVYDNHGNIEKYIYDPDNPNFYDTNKKVDKKVATGDYFPELVLKTIDGEVVKIKDLKGKMIILRFEFEADTFRFKKQEIADLDDEINESNRKSEIESIIIFASDKQEIQKGFDLEGSNFKLVPNGFNFHQKLQINSFPSTMIIDREGRLMEELQWSDEIDILDLLNKA